MKTLLSKAEFDVKYTYRLYPRCHPRDRSPCFAKQNLELLDPGIHLLFLNLDPRVKKSHCFSTKNKPFLARG
jgi:hypothetical protein